jgi:hypothetical protein
MKEETLPATSAAPRANAVIDRLTVSPTVGVERKIVAVSPVGNHTLAGQLVVRKSGFDADSIQISDNVIMFAWIGINNRLARILQSIRGRYRKKCLTSVTQHTKTS